MYKTISAREFAALCASAPCKLIDVRTPAEFAELRVAFAHNLPLDKITADAVMSLRSSPDEMLYFVCKAGGRSRQACEKLHASGLGNLVNVDGGTPACEQAGVAVTRGM